MRKTRQMPVPETLYTKVRKNATGFYCKRNNFVRQIQKVLQLQLMVRLESGCLPTAEDMSTGSKTDAQNRADQRPVCE